MSPHFPLSELTASQTATRRGLDNTPPAAVLVNLSRLAVLMEQVRLLANGPIRVSSGYRCPALNRAIGGSATSAHVHGLAADIIAPGMTPQRLAQLIRDSGLVYDQLILEFDRWVHIGLSTGNPRNQDLTATLSGGRVNYSQGIA